LSSGVLGYFDTEIDLQISSIADHNVIDLFASLEVQTKVSHKDELNIKVRSPHLEALFPPYNKTGLFVCWGAYIWQHIRVYQISAHLEIFRHGM
jgi:hypothetical protein